MADAPLSEREGPVLDFSQKPSAIVSPSMFAESLRRGWQVTPERKVKYFAALDTAVDEIKNIPDAGKRATIAAQCARVLVQEQAAALRDVHHTENIENDNGIQRLKMDRAEQGLPNDSLALVLPTVAQLPLPDFLSKRAAILEPGKN